MSEYTPRVGDIVTLAHEDDCIVPAGVHTVSTVNEDGSFHVGGSTAVWPRRVIALQGEYELSRPTQFIERSPVRYKVCKR